MKLSDLFSHWDQVHKDTLSVIDRFSEAELAHVSYVGGWPVGLLSTSWMQRTAGSATLRPRITQRGPQTIRWKTTQPRKP